MVRPARFERAAFRLGGERSILLSYGRKLKIGLKRAIFVCFQGVFEVIRGLCFMLLANQMLIPRNRLAGKNRFFGDLQMTLPPLVSKITYG